MSKHGLFSIGLGGWLWGRMGVFITKISPGRTLRELILGGISYGTLGCVVFFAILGNYALYLEVNQLFPVIETLNSTGAPAAIVGVLGTYRWPLLPY